MIGAEIRRYASDQRGLRLNVFLGIAGGAFGSLAETLVLPNLVLAYFVAKLTTSFAIIGFVPAIGIGLWLLARLLAAAVTSPHRRQLPWAVAAALVRAGATALLAAVCFRVPVGAILTPELQYQMLRAFFLCYVVYSIASGFASVPITAMVTKSIPHEARPMFFRQRALWGGGLALIGGVVVSRLLGSTGPAFPRDYALLFLVATICHTATAFFVVTLREPIRVAVARLPLPLSSIRAVPTALADSSYRRFLVFRLLLAGAALLDPFLIVFALLQLGATKSVVGVYLIAFTFGRLATVPVWTRFTIRHGEKASLQVVALVRLAPPLLAILLPDLATTRLFQERVAPFLATTGVFQRWFADWSLPSLLFAVAFVALGAAAAGQAGANVGYLAVVAPVRLRAVYAGLTSAILALAAVAPVAGGLLIDRRDLDTLLLVATAMALLAVFASGALTLIPGRPRAPAEAWRLRQSRTGSPLTARGPGDLS